MSSPAAESSEPLVAAEETADAAAPAAGVPVTRRLPAAALPAMLAVALLALGSALLASNLGLLAPAAERAVRVTWPAGLIFAGLGLIVAGERLWKAGNSPFRVEQGDAEQADLLVSAGTADVQVGTAPEAGPLAAGEWPARQGPDVTVQDRRATLRLEPPLDLPALGGAKLRVGLAKVVPWRMNLRTSTGNLELKLAELTVAELRLRSTFGDVDLTLPAAGASELDLALVFGDLTVRVPEGVGVRIKLADGPLLNVQHDERRFVQLAPNEWGTPLYAVAPNRCTLSVRLRTGDLYLG